MNPIVLSIDPSGAYNEGQGTTGWLVMKSDVRRVNLIGSISALKYSSDVAYWDAHLQLIHTLRQQYPDLCLLVEDYLLYAHKTEAQVNSRFETSQLIGILKHYAYKNDIPFYMQRAAEVKARWENAVLLKKNYLCKIKGHFCLPDSALEIGRHELDAYRHALHFCTFYNK